MIDLLDFLSANGFTNYIASGGGRDFMRPITSEIYGISSERVIGTSAGLRYQDDDTGGTIVYEASMDELEQVREIHPRLAKHIGPPCVVRNGLAAPRCTEGTHFCGVPVWRDFPNVERRL